MFLTSTSGYAPRKVLLILAFFVGLHFILQCKYTNFCEYNHQNIIIFCRIHSHIIHLLYYNLLSQALQETSSPLRGSDRIVRIGFRGLARTAKKFCSPLRYRKLHRSFLHPYGVQIG